MVIDIKNVSKSFKYGAGKENRIFEGYSQTIESGQFVVFTGVSGCGKTTLLNMIGGLDEPNAGEISIDGTVMGSLTSAQKAHFLNRNHSINSPSLGLLQGSGSNTTRGW